MLTKSAFKIKMNYEVFCNWFYFLKSKNYAVCEMSLSLLLVCCWIKAWNCITLKEGIVCELAPVIILRVTEDSYL